jgi:hypothetical protein
MKNNNNQKNEKKEEQIFESWKGAFLAFTELSRP